MGKFSQFIYSFTNAVPVFNGNSATLAFHDGGYDNFVKDFTTGSTFESSASASFKSALSLVAIMALII